MQRCVLIISQQSKKKKMYNEIIVPKLEKVDMNPEKGLTAYVDWNKAVQTEMERSRWCAATLPQRVRHSPS